MFAATTVLIVFIGFSQWRRQRIIDKGRWFATQGFELDIPNGFRDLIWQRMPKVGRISAHNYQVLFHGPSNQEYERVQAVAQQWMKEFPGPMEEGVVELRR
jgi:hypothetical protein